MSPACLESGEGQALALRLEGNAGSFSACCGNPPQNGARGLSPACLEPGEGQALALREEEVD